MNSRKWWAAVTAATVVTASVVGAGVVLSQQNGYTSAAAQTISTPTTGLSALQATSNLNTTALSQVLAEMAEEESLGNFSAVIRDVTNGTVVYEAQPEAQLLPASSTKMLTAAAALLELGPGAQVATHISKLDSQTLVIHAGGDVWLDTAALADLAAQVSEATDISEITTIRIVNEAWSAPEFLSGWDTIDISEGYIAPMQPAMLNGARIGGTTGDLPRSTNPMQDVAYGLADALEITDPVVEVIAEYTQPDEVPPQYIASWYSAALSERIDEMMLTSDNVMAEAIGRELDGADPVGKTLEVLASYGLNNQDISVADNSGLSLDNRINAQYFADLMDLVVSEESLHNIVLGLPVAGGTGTLEDRYATAAAKGWARAKTGTLTGVVSLVGVVPSVNGHMYSFALISNEADILGARAQMDAMVSELRVN